MFGTLIIQLPSNYEGGQLIVHHQAKSKAFDFGGQAGSCNFHYIAFYADCQHEIKPLTEGYRLCLVYTYGLVYTGYESLASPADNSKAVSTIVASMREWDEAASSSEACPPMMVYMLEHQYCKASLYFEMLKGQDRAMANILLQAKSEVDFDLYIAQVDVMLTMVTWRWRMCGEDVLSNESITAENLMSPAGKHIPSVDLFNEDDNDRPMSSHNPEIKKYFVPKDFVCDMELVRQESIPDTGNEGARHDKEYKHAALLLWPSVNHILALGMDNMISLIRLDKHKNPAKVKLAAKELVSACSHQTLTHYDDSSLLECVVELEYQELISEVMKLIVSSRIDSLSMDSFHENVVKIAGKLGWSILKSPLQAIIHGVANSSSWWIKGCTKFLDTMLHSEASEAQREVCHSLASAIVETIPKVKDEPRDYGGVVKLLSAL